MRKNSGISAAIVLAVAMSATASAQAQRAETVTTAIVAVADTCALTPDAVFNKGGESTKEAFWALFAPILAAFAGDLAKSGVNALGDALEQASREQGFVAEGAAGYHAGQIDFIQPMTKAADGSDIAVGWPNALFTPKRKCLHLAVPGADAIDLIFSDAVLTADNAPGFDWRAADPKAATAAQKTSRNRLVALGITNRPVLYAEILLLPGKEAFVARPLLIWNGSGLKGAPKSASAAELHLLFATPGFDAAKSGIGTGFAGTRTSLPKLAPQQVLGWDALKGKTSILMPLRPSTGYVDNSVTAFNTAVTQVATAKAALRKAESAHAAAKRLAARGNKPESVEALILAAEAEEEAKRALQIAELTIADRQSAEAGAINVQARVVIIRDENKFGMALAKALKGQAEAVGKATTDAIAPKPDWTAGDTAYLTALQDVELKQKAYDDALAAGDAAATVSAAHALKLSKAKANEAAVASKRQLPYPGLLN